MRSGASGIVNNLGNIGLNSAKVNRLLPMIKENATGEKEGSEHTQK